jgi:hypothetical protein
MVEEFRVQGSGFRISSLTIIETSNIPSGPNPEL